VASDSPLRTVSSDRWLEINHRMFMETGAGRARATDM
jgi:hypothetical protein